MPPEQSEPNKLFMVDINTLEEKVGNSPIFKFDPFQGKK